MRCEGVSKNNLKFHWISISMTSITEGKRLKICVSKISTMKIFIYVQKNHGLSNKDINHSYMYIFIHLFEGTL